MSERASLWGIGTDLLSVHILPLLELRDLLSISSTSRGFHLLLKGSGIWKRCLANTYPFDSDIKRDIPWHDVPKSRQTAQAFVWGDDFTLGEYLKSRARPTLCDSVSIKNDSILQLLSFGDGLAVLYKSGNVFLSAGSKGFRQAFVSDKHGRSPKPITKIQGGRYYLYGLTSGGGLWRSDTWSKKCECIFEDKEDHDNFYALTDISAYWDEQAAILFDGMGLRIWKDHPRSGTTEDVVLPLKGGMSIEMIAAGAGFVITVLGDGKIYGLNSGLTMEDKVLDLKRLNWETIADSELVAEPETEPERTWTCISAGYNRAAAIHSSGCVYMAYYENGEFRPPVKVQFPEGEKPVSLALGDHHNLALTHNGAVFAWGTESQNSGSLGLGTAEELLSLGAVQRPVRRPGYHDHTISSPTRLNIQRKAVQISASHWHSTALLLDYMGSP